MKKIYGLLCVAVLFLIPCMTACKFEFNKAKKPSTSNLTYVDYRIDVNYLLTYDTYENVKGNIINIYEQYEDEEPEFDDNGNQIYVEKKVDLKKFTVSVEKCSDLDVGKTMVTVTYKDEERDVPVWKASQESTSEPELLSDYTGSLGESSDTVKYYKFGDYPCNTLGTCSTDLMDDGVTEIREVTDSNGDTLEISTQEASNGYLIGQDGNYYYLNKSDDKVYAVKPIVWVAVTDEYDYDGHFEDAAASASCTKKATLLITDKVIGSGIPFFDVSSTNDDNSYKIYSKVLVNEDGDPVDSAGNLIEYPSGYVEENGEAITKELAETYMDYYETDTIRTIDGKTVYSNNYKYSTIRAFLNGLKYDTYAYDNGSYDTREQVVSSKYYEKGFLQQAFSEDAQKKLITTTVLNDGKSGTFYSEADGLDSYATDGTSGYQIDFSCDNTQDKVFLLSSYEATMPALGGTGEKSVNDGGYKNGNLNKTRTDFAGEPGYYEELRGYHFRSPSYNDAYSNRQCARYGVYNLLCRLKRKFSHKEDLLWKENF